MARTHRAPPQLPPWFVVAAGLLPSCFLVAFYVWPVVNLFAVSFDGGQVVDTIRRQATWKAWWFTTWQAALSTVITTAVGLAPTWAIARYRFRGRQLLISLLSATFVLPTVVLAVAVGAVLPDHLARGPAGIIAVHVLFNLAVVQRVVGAVWERIPQDLTAAANSLGASPWRAFLTVTFPLIAPGVLGAASIIFAFCFTSYGVVRILGDGRYATVEVEVWRRAIQLGDLGGAAMLSVIQLIMLGVMVWATTRWQQRTATPLRHGHPVPRSLPYGSTKHGVMFAAWGAGGVVALPLFTLVERSFRVRSGYTAMNWLHLGQLEIRPGLRLDVDPWAALGNSMSTAVVATALAVLVGGCAAITISTVGLAGKLLDVGLMLPLATSAVTVGLGLLITFDAAPVDWRASWFMVPLGHALVAVPFVVRSVLAVVRGVDPDLAFAAQTLGASPLRAWASSVVPAMLGPLAMAAGLSAAISLGEFGATSLLSRSGGDTLPLAIERLAGRTGDLARGQAYVLATMLAAATIGIVVTVDRLVSRQPRSARGTPTFSRRTSTTEDRTANHA